MNTEINKYKIKNVVWEQISYKIQAIENYFKFYRHFVN